MNGPKNDLVQTLAENNSPTYLVVDTHDTLNVVLVIGLVVGLALVIYLIYHLVRLIKEARRTLEVIRLVVEDIKDTTGDIKEIKNNMKRGVVGILVKLLQKVGGDLNE